MQTAKCGLDRCFLCKHSLEAWKELIGLKKKTLQFKKGKTIFSEGEPVNGIFFINEGAVKVTMCWGGGKELLLRFAKGGDVLGHRGFGGDMRYPISATALTDTKVCFIDSAFLSNLLAADAGLSYHLLQLYAAELQRAEKRMRNLAHMDVKGRIAQGLLDLLQVFGTGEDGYITVPVTRQDIASYAGTTYETVFKFMVELTTNGTVATAGKAIKINHPEGLAAFLQAEPV